MPGVVGAATEPSDEVGADRVDEVRVADALVADVLQCCGEVGPEPAAVLVHAFEVVG